MYYRQYIDMSINNTGNNTMVISVIIYNRYE